MSPAAPVGWRAFPWDPAAAAGDRGSPGWVPPIQGAGRFDLPGSPGGVVYLAETPDHAVAERIQAFRGRELRLEHLLVEGRALALVAFDLDEDLRAGVVDLCRPEVLVELELPPDRIAARDRSVTQGIATRLHAGGRHGLRWWSAFFGEWHTVALFRDRLGAPLAHGAPEPLGPEHPAVADAAAALGMRVSRRA